ncbi:MAG: 3-phosphoshikimate 1-carboxyvinyltransferase [Candidatus Woesearchaeota archaeon]|jgi:3-phosphoshikimate 1-carboxyvinyltransferase|nr:3-phosphoshikimate 1-carboxyvinyltransferase [Candidatus Woesearchaeota archaeon]
MKLIVKPTKKLKGEIQIPASKSHTIRAIVIASLAEGTSKIKNSLDSADTKAAIDGCLAVGAEIEKRDTTLIIKGFNGQPKQPKKELNLLNSGTSINLLTSVAALGDFPITLNGDSSLQKRPVQPLLDALNNLGAKADSLNNNNCPPIKIEGPMKGGTTTINCKSSQYVSSLLIACPLIKNDTQIKVKNLCETPYIELTLGWLDEQKIRYENKNLSEFKIYGNQKYKPFNKSIPSDWSSAAFPLVAAAITESDVTLTGLDIKDSQGDKQIIDYLKKMGANIKISENKVRIKGTELKGTALDLNHTPDALPAVSILACYAKGTTTINNVGHARIKETDRIKIMKQELSKMGADIKEKPDGLIIKHSRLKGARVNGHHDHRVVMALSLAGLIADGQTEIGTAEAIDVTFPSYIKLMKKLNANMEVI